LSHVTAAASAKHFAIDPGTQVDKPSSSFAPSDASVDLADASVAASLLVPSVDDDGYVDTASSHCQNKPHLWLMLLCPQIILHLLRFPRMCIVHLSATAAQCLGVPSSFLGSNCQL
jgi:hypothetical protein